MASVKNIINMISGLMFTAIVLLAVCGAEALVVVDGQDNSSAPDDDPGWEYVGAFANGTGVYLGNQWAVTAKHLGITASSIFTLNGQSYNITPGPIIYNDDGTPADLQLFQLHQDPDLAVLDIRKAQIEYNEQVTVIATGRTAGEMFNEIGYYGYQWNTVREKLWGNNTITPHAKVGTPIVYNGKKTYSFSTQFDTQPLADSFEAQAADKDSGGGAFIKNDLEQWELAGIIFSIEARFPSEPYATLDYDDTFYVNLSHYRHDIMATMHLAGDANRDNIVNLSDLDILGNHFNKTSLAWEDGDFNGDDRVTLIDLDLMGDNFGQSASSAPVSTATVEPDGGWFDAVDVPEPMSTGIWSVGIILAVSRRRYR